MSDGKSTLFEDRATLSVEEMAAVVGVSRPTAYQLAHAEDGPPVLRIGRRIRVPREGLMRWMERRSEKENAS